VQDDIKYDKSITSFAKVAFYHDFKKPHINLMSLIYQEVIQILRKKVSA